LSVVFEKQIGFRVRKYKLTSLLIIANIEVKEIQQEVRISVWYF